MYDEMPFLLVDTLNAYCMGVVIIIILISLVRCLFKIRIYTSPCSPTIDAALNYPGVRG